MFSKWFGRDKKEEKKPVELAEQPAPLTQVEQPQPIEPTEPPAAPAQPTALDANESIPSQQISTSVEASGSDTSTKALEAAAPTKLSFRERLKAGLQATRSKLTVGIHQLFGTGAKLDDDTYEALETLLLSADVGVQATTHLLDDLRKTVREQQLGDVQQVKAALKASLTQLVSVLEAPLNTNIAHPFVMMMVGVNGAGKTTSIGKLAKYFQGEGKSVVLAAGDTFRAAAREQLVTWGERNGVHVFTQSSGDSAAVIFDAVQSARAKSTHIVLADTAGRLPTQLHLMEEIKKVKRVIAKAEATAPHEIMLVIDGNTGQNALAQVKAFHQALGLTGLIITKLDGTAKGGSIAAIAKECPVPIRFIGVGETLDDLRPFVAAEFVDALIE
jgi:fused signal recognition particle receptor